MDLLSLFLCLLIVFYCFVSILKRSKISRKLPPGPCPLPLIGNLLELGDMPHESLANLAKTYGPIMSLKLGQITHYVVSSPTLAKEIFQKQDLIFSTRSMPNALHTHDHFKYSVAWMPVSDRWRNLRKILKAVIFQTNKLNASQNIRREKMYDLIAYVRKCCDEGVAIDIGCAASTTLLNILSNIMFSQDLGESLLEELNGVISSIMINTGKKNLSDFFPVLEIIDPQGLRRQMTNSFKKMFKIVSKFVDKRIESRTSKKNSDMNDLLDTLLDIGEDISRTQVEYLLTDLFIAGTDTTSTTVEWAMAEVLSNSKILEKLRAELEVTVGRGIPIEESDIAHLPYLRAVVEETLRKHPPGPLISRTVEVDAEISKYIIPKGARVQVNVWAMARDPDLWERPNMFEPQRFIGSDIDIRAHNFEHNPFGVGRRSCLGVPLATRIVPVMIGSLINSFEWKLENGITPEQMDMEEKYGFTLRKAQPLRVVPTTI